MPSHGMLLWPICFAVFLTLHTVCALELAANFNMGGVVGRVTFMSGSGNGPIVIDTTNIVGNLTSEEYDWSIREFPVIYDSATPCEDLGSILNFLPLASDTAPECTVDASTTKFASCSTGALSLKHGGLSQARVNKQFYDSAISLQGSESVLGRGLLLTGKSTGKMLCATITSGGPVTTAIAKLRGPSIAGTVVIRQDTELSYSSVTTDLYFVDVTSTPATFDWEVRQVSCDGSVMDNRGVSTGACSTTNQAACWQGNLAGKHGQVSVGAVSSSARHFFLDLNLSGMFMVPTALFLVVTSGTDVLSCTEITVVMPKAATVYFNDQGVTGTITFVQNSRFDPTLIHLDLKNLQGTAGGYHVHEFPAAKKGLITGSDACSDNNVGGHHNPFSVNAATGPMVALGTPDEYEVGDLSSKFGFLTGTEAKSQHWDPNLPLFGPRSIIGRALVIHKLMDNSRWACANIEDESPGGGDASLIMAEAIFVYPISGRIMMRQAADDPFADTWIYVDLAWSDGSVTDTASHKWQIHESEVGQDFLASSNRCDSAGSHFNPYSVDTAGNYASECTGKHDALRCESGDLYSKHGALAVSGDVGTAIGQRFFTDTNLPLSGNNSVVGRSLVVDIADLGVGRLACATIRTLHGVQAKAAFDMDPMTGSVMLSQESPLDRVDVAVTLTDLNFVGGGFHIHALPVDYTKPGLCSAASVSGHFNPFNTSFELSPLPTIGTQDEYEVGDLSGKYGMLNSAATYSYNPMSGSKPELYDSNIQIMGPNSVVGRSVVIHKQADKSRWACKDISFIPQDGGVVKMAAANFVTGPLRGFVRMKQITYPDGAMSDTSIDINLWYAADLTKITSQHQWHVHQLVVNGDGESESGRCASTADHYNPFMVDITNSTVYGSRCGFETPLHCELGDISSKQANYDVGSGNAHFTDSYLPLSGNFNVVGRSIVVHVENGGAGRFACADILAEEEITVAGLSMKPNSHVEIGAVIASAIKLNIWNVDVAPAPEKQSSCAYDVHVRAENTSNLAEKVEYGTILSSYEIFQCSGSSRLFPTLLPAFLLVIFCKILTYSV